eukprot:11232737-Alexandrium_andersonii.AAC.2
MSQGLRGCAFRRACSATPSRSPGRSGANCARALASCRPVSHSNPMGVPLARRRSRAGSDQASFEQRWSRGLR